MIQIISLMGRRRMAVFDIEPKLIKSPKGSENKSVKEKSLSVPKNPLKRARVTVANIE